MSSEGTEAKLVRMANQIGTFFGQQGTGAPADEEAVTAITQHILDFWDPRMRRQILEHLDAGGAGLDPLVLAAVRRLAEKTPAA